MANAKHTRARAVCATPDRGVLSCIAVRRDDRGRHVGEELFDVPAEAYAPGFKRGEAIALECLALMRAQGAPGLGFDVIVRAAEVIGQETGTERPSRRGAAVGFMRTIERFAELGARAQGIAPAAVSNWDVGP